LAGILRKKFNHDDSKYYDNLTNWLNMLIIRRGLGGSMSYVVVGTGWLNELY
jgi:hypothetical protein